MCHPKGWRFPQIHPLKGQPNIVMPVVSIFFGIVIRMYYREHGPPHFHAEYQGQRATFSFNGDCLNGSIGSHNALRLIRKWSVARRLELESNWDRIRAGEPLESIAPLD